jgi:L-ascorbate metabolism protein UlaG (beta-lactamase superfamily)
MLAALLGALFSCAGPAYPRSDHFDGTRFHNPQGEEPKSLASVIRWKLTSFDRPDWQTQMNVPPGRKPPSRVARGALRVTFVNHATLLLQYDGINVLTDPIWSERASPFSWIGPKRVRPPGIRFEDLPPIDLVVVSHDHYDHMDLPTLRRLGREHRPRFLVPLGNAALLRDSGLRDVHERDWWQAITMPNGARATVVPAQHFCARGPFDRDRALWAGFVLETVAGPIFFAGDTAKSEHFAQIRARFGAMRLAILPIGAYEPRWFMKAVHVNPAEALEAHDTLDAQTSVAMHFGTFHLADESQTGAQEALAAAIKQRPAPKPQFWVLGFGDGMDVPPLALR